MVGPCGGQSSFTMCRLNLNFKFLGEILGSHAGGGSIIFDHVQANMNFKILGEILGSHTGGVNHLSPCAS